MGIEENKALVRDYMAKMGKGDPSLPELLSEDVTWWVPPGAGWGGLYEGKESVLELMGRGVALYLPPMRVTVEQMVAEGDFVCVQFVLEAKTARGRDYKNYYHFSFQVRDAKICAVKEYVDTKYVANVLFGE